MQPVFSVLICSLWKRAGMLATLLSNLEEQIERLGVIDLVEIRISCDNGELPTGSKRNILMNQATGKYSVFVDDDDKLPDYYIEEVLKGVESDPDCLSMSGIMTTNGVNEQYWNISKDFEYRTLTDFQGKESYERFPNHITIMKRAIASQFKFPDIYMFEDYQWACAIRQSGLIKTEYRIPRHPMYHYDFRPSPSQKIILEDKKY